MKKRSLLYVGLGLAFLVWVLNSVALNLYLYWTVGWYDVMMHFLGGLTIGVLVMWVLGFENRSWKNFLIAFIAVLIVGVGWEIFEYINGMTFSTEKYAEDVFHDIVMDSLGAIVAYLFSTSSSKSISPTQSLS